MIEVEDMRNRFLQKYVKILSDTDNDILDKIKVLKQSSETLPFDLCNFDNDGRCETFRKDGWQCLCVECDTFCGYIKYTTEEELIMYAEAYDDKTGFFREGIGCVLPREYRSRTCLSYYCIKDSKIKDFSERLGLLEKEYIGQKIMSDSAVKRMRM